MKRHDEEELKNLEEQDEIKKEEYEEYLDNDEEVVEPEKTPISHIVMIVSSTLLLLSTIGIMAWGFTDVQKERQNAMTELTLQEGKAVVVTEDKPDDKEDAPKMLSYEEASERMEGAVKRFEEHATKTDELSEEFIKNSDKIRTTEWSMEYQSHMKQIRLAYSEIETIANQTESGVYGEYTSMLRDLIEIADVRYEAIYERDGEKLVHAIQLSKELQKKTESMFE